MKWPRLQGGRLQDRIVVFFVVLLMGVQLASFYLIRYAIDQTAQGTLREELDLGARVFGRLLRLQSQQLREGAFVLTADFGFRDAVATRDRETIVSALANQAARFNSSGMVVVGLDNVVVADSLHPENAGKLYAHRDLVATAADVGRAGAIRLVDREPYQVVVVPVLAPVPIAYVALLLQIDDNVARDLRALTNAEVAFVVLSSTSHDLLATTVPRSRREAFAERLPQIVQAGAQGVKVTLAGEEYRALASPLDVDGAGTRIYAILLRAVDDAIAPFRLLEVALLVITGLSLLLTLVGAVRIAQRISRPIAQLATAVREIERGNYAVRVGRTGSDEMAELGRAFDGMARGLAERDTIRDVLGKVASPEVAQKLLAGEIELGGQEIDATVMFTDIRNFTTICEGLSPHESLALLNEFLTEISAVVEAHEGVVDKFLGDGVMAIFGAPVTRPDDARRAVATALDIAERIALLRPQLAARGLPHPDVGVGLNTSRVVGGNVGSASRLNYTVLGDGVNLAARLEGLTKRYQVPIVCGSRTRESVTGIVFRELDKVRVRGRREAERIFEPLGREGQVAAREMENLARWDAALAHFRARRWVQAKPALESLADEYGYGRLVAIYLGYIRELEANPPGDGWDAAFTLYEK